MRSLPDANPNPCYGVSWPGRLGSSVGSSQGVAVGTYCGPEMLTAVRRSDVLVKIDLAGEGRQGCY